MLPRGRDFFPSRLSTERVLARLDRSGQEPYHRAVQTVNEGTGAMKRIMVMLAVSALAVGACRDAPPRPDAPAPRIVAFSPALTQILFDMGLGDHVVGVTSQCILPPGERRQRLGDAINHDPETVIWADPDIMLVQMQIKHFAAVAGLAPEIRIEHFKIESLAHVRDAIERLGSLVADAQAANRTVEQFDAKLAAIRERVAGRARPRVLFTLGYWNPSVPGRGTFIGDMIELAGGVNAGAPDGAHLRWRNPALEEISVAAPDVIICQVDTGKEEQARDYWRQRSDLPAARTGRIHIVTDRRWTIPSTYSPTLAEQMAEMIHAPAPVKEPGQ